MRIQLHTLRNGESPGHVAIHGLFGSSSDWKSAVDASTGLKEVLAISLPGHGGVALQKGNNPSFESLVERIGEELSSRLTQPVHGIGYSLGGRLLLGLSTQHHKLFSRITLISTFPGYESADERKSRLIADREWAASLKALPLREWARHWYGQSIFASDTWSPDFWELMVNRLSEVDIGIAAELLVGLSAAGMPSYWDFLTTSSMPITIVAGERDLKYVSIACELARRNPKISVVRIANSGHSIVLERPDQVGKLAFND